jgi:hypothetical protein
MKVILSLKLKVLFLVAKDFDMKFQRVDCKRCDSGSSRGRRIPLSSLGRRCGRLRSSPLDVHIRYRGGYVVILPFFLRPYVLPKT